MCRQADRIKPPLGNSKNLAGLSRWDVMLVQQQKERAAAGARPRAEFGFSSLNSSLLQNLETKRKWKVLKNEGTELR